MARLATGRRRAWPLRVVALRPRLFGSLAVALAVAGLLAAAPRWGLPTRTLIAWDVGVALYLILAFHMMSTSTVEGIRRRAAQEDEGQVLLLALTVAAAVASLAAIVAELGISADHEAHPLAIVLATVTILLSWTLIHTIFALHYAHEFYDETAGGGMAFPGGEAEPDYWDFVYFSFVIGMTSQVSDVGVTSKPIRRTVAAHGVVAFLFNVALLALTVNLAASAIGGPVSPPGR